MRGRSHSGMAQRAPMASRASWGEKAGSVTWRPPTSVIAYTANTSTRWNMGAKWPHTSCRLRPISADVGGEQAARAAVVQAWCVTPPWHLCGCTAPRSPPLTHTFDGSHRMVHHNAVAQQHSFGRARGAARVVQVQAVVGAALGKRLGAHAVQPAARCCSDSQARLVLKCLQGRVARQGCDAAAMDAWQHSQGTHGVARHLAPPEGPPLGRAARGHPPPASTRLC